MTLRIRGARAILGTTATDLSVPGPDDVLDAEGCVVTPGLVNAHHHLLQSAFRTLPGTRGVPMSTWLPTMAAAYVRARVDEELVYLAARVGMAEALLCGVTTVADHHLTWPATHTPEATVALARATERATRELGGRLVFVRGSAGDDPETAAHSTDLIAEALAPTGAGGGVPAPTGTAAFGPIGVGTQAHAPTGGNGAGSTPTGVGGEALEPAGAGGAALGPTGAGADTFGPTGVGTETLTPTEVGTRAHAPNRVDREGFVPGGVSADGMVQVAVGPAGVHSDSAETFRLLGEVARRRGLRRRTQANEQVDVVIARERYGRRPLELLDEWGWLAADVTLAHLCEVTSAEITRLSGAGVTATHAPGCDLPMGWGIAPVAALRAAGVTVGLGTSGGGSNDAGHLLADARLAMQVAPLVGPPLSALDVLTMATTGSATGLGRPELATLASGDLCVWDTSGVADAGVADPIAGLLWANPGRRPRHVVVAGRVVVRDGRLVHADESEITTALHHRLAPTKLVS